MFCFGFFERCLSDKSDNFHFPAALMDSPRKQSNGIPNITECRAHRDFHDKN